MPKTDRRVDAYLRKAPAFARPILERVRAAVHAGCPDVEETLKWGKPAFLIDGKILCGTAAFKAHCSFGFWHAGMEPHMRKAGLGGEHAMMGTRLTDAAELPSQAVLAKLVSRAVALTRSGVPARAPRTKRAANEAEVPADLADELRRNAAAAATFAGFPPSCRREYVAWITEAKRPETRAKRLATTLEWLAAGKRRNWKYENC